MVVRDNQLMKALQMFASKRMERPALRCAEIKDGVLSITDSHVLLQKPTSLPDMTIDLYTLEDKKDINYPDVSRIVGYDKDNLHTLTKEHIKAIYDFVKQHKNKSDRIKLAQEEDGELYVVHYKDTTPLEQLTLPSTQGVSFKYMFSSQCLLAILNYLMLTEEETNFWTSKPTTPINLEQGEAKLMLTSLHAFVD
mgnify:FL=1